MKEIFSLFFETIAASLTSNNQTEEFIKSLLKEYIELFNSNELTQQAHDGIKQGINEYKNSINIEKKISSVNDSYEDLKYSLRKFYRINNSLFPFFKRLLYNIKK